MLAVPSWTVLEMLSGHPIVECGAGDGTWMNMLKSCGADVIGYDPHPRGPDVLQGDHRALAGHSDRVLLIVWPPDTEDIGEWIKAWGGSMLAICGDFGRFTAPEMTIYAQWPVYGSKGTSQFVFGQI